MINEKQPKTLPHWVYQQAFAKLSREVFDYLDEDLRPKFLIVGLTRIDDAAVWIEPSENSGYSHDDFRGVLESAVEIEAEEVAKTAWKNQSINNTDVQVTAKSIQRALEKTLHNRDAAAHIISYCSDPVSIGDYDVCCVLQFDEPAFSKHFSVPVRRLNNSRLAGSLIDATAVEFLRVCRTVLEGPRRTLNGLDPLGHQPEDILRMGGRTLMLTANQVGAGTTFDDLNKLSWKTHEGEIAGGELHFIHWDEYYLDIHIEFKHPPRLSDIEAARKLIEMAAAKSIATGKMHLISHGDVIGGIGSLREAEDEYDSDNLDVFVVRFTGYYKWELWHQNGGLLMQVVSGVPSLPRQPISDENFKDHITRTFTKSAPDVDALLNIVTRAASQKHGTMIVISSAAAEEAERLAEQSTVLREPVKLVGELLDETLLMLSAIDGAVLVDPTGTCYAAGVILDGLAIKGKGSSSRGARYNSAIRYVYGARRDPSKGECLAVVISKDGKINLVRELRKRILRSEVTAHIEQVRAATSGESVASKAYYKAMLWLSDHRFYLSAEQCSELNQIKESARAGFTPYDFVPDEEMDESYFLDE